MAWINEGTTDTIIESQTAHMAKSVAMGATGATAGGGIGQTGWVRVTTSRQITTTQYREGAYTKERALARLVEIQTADTGKKIENAIITRTDESGSYRITWTETEYGAITSTVEPVG